ncbi:Ribonuclease H [Abeliophyllum distichum]|uniref:Ribonuclease H n=1 Tax=Abeliophyllum distichum TaxID=126358 RepID=A0ABD1RFG5_9LAMI
MPSESHPESSSAIWSTSGGRGQSQKNSDTHQDAIPLIPQRSSELDGKGGKRFEWTEEYEKAFQDLKILLGKAPLLSKPKVGEILLVYLVVSEKAVSSVLIQEEGPVQLPVYYALADFVTEFAHIPEGSLEARPEEVPTWKLYVDGSSGKVGARAGILLISPNGHNLNCVLRLEFKASNNTAEYEALFAGLRLAQEMKARKLQR